jgi:hypothetical protein
MVAANAAWLASLETDLDVDVVSVPAGILAGGGYRWGHGDCFTVDKRANPSSTPHPYRMFRPNGRNGTAFRD